MCASVLCGGKCLGTWLSHLSEGRLHPGSHGQGTGFTLQAGINSICVAAELSVDGLLVVEPYEGELHGVASYDGDSREQILTSDVQY